MLGSEELLLAGQDRTEDKLSKHSVCSRNTYPGDDRKEPGACLQSGADLQPNFSTHHTLLNPLKGRLKWKPCPLLLLLSWAALLHRLVLHQAKCSNPTSNILLFVFFFFPSALLLNWQIGHQTALCRCRCDAQSGDQFANPDCQNPVSFSSL